MTNRWIILLVAVAIAAILMMMLLVRRPDPVTPATNHTENAAPQAMLWTNDRNKRV